MIVSLLEWSDFLEENKLESAGNSGRRSSQPLAGREQSRAPERKVSEEGGWPPRKNAGSQPCPMLSS